MKRVRFVSYIAVFLIASLASAATQAAEPVIHHQLQVTLLPDSGQLQVTDKLQAPADAASFVLAESFTVRVDGQRLEPLETHDGLARYSWPDKAAGQTLTLVYESHIDSTEVCDWLRQTCRLLSPRGAYLDAGSHWYPQVPGSLHTFSLEVQLPDGWVSLSQGDKTAKGWQVDQPQDAIYLLAGPFKVYESVQNDRRALVYLQQPDEALAQTYLQATHRYLAHYSEMIGDYPYSKFATVESFWETGWGMPSFTLLGPQVIRLPFIPYTSLPHEILHNWWGNGVYIDASEGNWSEGLTAYLSDHEAQRQRGGAAAYRRDTLQKFSVFTRAGDDFPLAAFRSRHDNTTQAVGYGKSLMLFHMLNVRLGEATFQQGLQRFYANFRFRPASFDDLRRSFEAVSGESLTGFFDAWLHRTGAPRLKLESVQMENDKLQLRLQQESPQGAYPLPVRVRLTFADGEQQDRLLDFRQTDQRFSVDLDKPVVAVTVDPDYDVMRLPYEEELPASLNNLFAAKDVLLLASQEPASLTASLKDWLTANGKQVKALMKSEALPEEASLVLLNPDAERLDSLAPGNTLLQDDELHLPDARYLLDEHSAALSLVQGKRRMLVLFAPTEAALQVLLRKAPHYGKYSYIAFAAGDGKNLAKGQWPVTGSPLMWQTSAPD
ncbi:MAG: M1 family peptidase [Gammaproteobacteria bacterium]|nr:M1 family peptidase [Gammaproteobacteria bacterium]